MNPQRTTADIVAGMPFVDMTRGISGLCDRNMHEWCANRDHRESRCDCPCHWDDEEWLRRVTSRADSISRHPEGF